MRDSCQQDLDVVLVSQSHGDAVPRFHYEMRTIPSIRYVYTILNLFNYD